MRLFTKASSIATTELNGFDRELHFSIKKKIFLKKIKNTNNAKNNFLINK